MTKSDATGLISIRDLAHKVYRIFWYAVGYAMEDAVAGSAAMNLRENFKLRGFLIAAVLVLACQPAFAAKRVALVLGNSAYQNVAKLPNPVNDGAAIAERFVLSGERGR